MNALVSSLRSANVVLVRDPASGRLAIGPQCRTLLALGISRSKGDCSRHAEKLQPGDSSIYDPIRKHVDPGFTWPSARNHDHQPAQPSPLHQTTSASQPTAPASVAPAAPRCAASLPAAPCSPSHGVAENDCEDEEALTELLGDDLDSDDGDDDAAVRDAGSRDFSDDEDDSDSVVADVPRSGDALDARRAATSMHGSKPPVCIFESGLARMCQSTPQQLDPGLTEPLLTAMLEAITSGSPFRCFSPVETMLWSLLSSVCLQSEHVDSWQSGRFECRSAISLSCLMDFILPAYQRSRIGGHGGSKSKSASEVRPFQQTPVNVNASFNSFVTIRVYQTLIYL